MISLDHLIVHVTNPAASVQFYRDILGFHHEGRAGPFEIVRVNPGLTLDLMQSVPNTQAHLAFSVDRPTFDAVLERLRERAIPFGGEVFERDGRVAANAFGARGMADAVYFYDPDRHNLELRVYDKDG